MLVMANTFNIAADLAAMGAAPSLVIGGLSHEHALIFVATSVLLQVFVRYRRYAPALKFLTLALFLYVATAFTVHIPWGQAFARAVWPAAEVNATICSWSSRCSGRRSVRTSSSGRRPRRWKR